MPVWAEMRKDTEVREDLGMGQSGAFSVVGRTSSMEVWLVHAIEKGWDSQGLMARNRR